MGPILGILINQKVDLPQLKSQPDIDRVIVICFKIRKSDDDRTSCYTALNKNYIATRAG